MLYYHEFDRLFEKYECKQKAYSLQQWSKEDRTYESGCVWAQHFFDAYPPFTHKKISKLLSLLSKDREIIISHHNGLHRISNGYSIVGQHSTFKGAVADFVINYYDYLDDNIKYIVKVILNGTK